MKNISFWGLLLLCIGMAGCSRQNEVEDVPPTVDTVVVPKDTVVVPAVFVDRPLKAAIQKAQPMTGLVLWVDRARELDESYRNSIALEFSYCLPCKVVIGKTGDRIDYDWSSFDALLDDIASRDHQAIVRFRYEYPNSKEVDGQVGTTAVPAYIKAMAGYEESYSANPGGDGPTWYADWRSEELQWFTLQFYSDFYVRYGNDRRLAFLEVGFGHWSEYHIYGTPLREGVNFPSRDFQTRFFQHLQSQSTNSSLPWCVSIDAADDSYSPVSASDELLRIPFGLFDDSFMHEQHEIGSADGYNERLWRIMNGQIAHWGVAPCGGEVSYYSSRDQREFLNPQGLYGITWEQAAQKYHISFMIANDATDGPYGTAERFLEAAWASGYRLRITQLCSTADSTMVSILNEGIAPLYKDAYVEVNGVRGEQSLKGLLPQQQITIGIGTGGEELTVRIQSPHCERAIEYNANL